MEREIQNLVAAAMHKQKTISMVVNDQMDAESAAQQAQELDAQIADVDNTGDDAADEPAEAAASDSVAAEPQTDPEPQPTQDEAPKDAPAEEPANDEPEKKEPESAESEGVSVEAVSKVMPQHELRQKHAEKMAQMSVNLKRSKETHAKKVKSDAVALNKVKMTAAKASGVAGVLSKAKVLLSEAQHHIKLIEDEMPDAAKNVATARSAATEANMDLEKEMNKHHLSLKALRASRDEDQAEGHAKMLETIRQKRRDSASKLEEVQNERNTLDRIVRDAVRLMDRVVAEQAQGAPSTMSSLRVDAARAHVADVRDQRARMQQQLDQVQAEYQTAHDQLRDTELQAVLFDAKVGGTLTEGTVAELNAKMKLAAHADQVYARAMKYEQQLSEAKHAGKVQMEASAPLLRRTIRMLTKLKQEDQNTPSS